MAAGCYKPTKVAGNATQDQAAVSPQNSPQLSAFPNEHLERRSYATLVKLALLLGLLVRARPGTDLMGGAGAADCTALPEGIGPAGAFAHCSVLGRRWASGRARGSCRHEHMSGMQ